MVTGQFLRQRRAVAQLALLVVLLVSLLPSPLPAQEGWTITRMEVRVAVQQDGSLDIVEAIDVDFGTLERHGIFRDIPYLLNFDEKWRRRYDIDLHQVTDAEGRRLKVETSREGSLVRFKIGDPDKTITGKQGYRIHYRVRNALNPFPEHDELYWNATGHLWPVPIAEASVLVTTPAEGIERVACYQGVTGSQETCAGDFTSTEARFGAGRSYQPGEGMSVVVGLRKGLVPEPRFDLVKKPRTAEEYFERGPAVLGATGLAFAAALGGLGALWWRAGRDRRYTTMHYLTEDPREQTRPLFSSDQVVVEFEPPQKLRPAQIGLVVDERADTLDVTATIVDLAVRGYLRITEIPKRGWFGKKDWQLDRLKGPDSGLLEYERLILDGLFEDGSTVKMSELRNEFYTHLARAQDALYKDAAARKWFGHNPATVKRWYQFTGLLVMAAGGGLMYLLGRWWGAAIAGAPVVLAGGLLWLMAGVMPRRTAAGRELLRRSLGFRRYIATAEKNRQAFNERAMIFAEYLPYAIVFECVDRWARAFEGIDTRAATAGWYAGTSRFDAPSFSRDLQGFSGSVSSAIASTPGGSGSSGFSGGSSGGGGGGGGGGSW